MLVLNLIETNYILPFAIGLTVIFAVSLYLPMFRKNRVFEICVAVVLFSCFLFYGFQTMVVNPQLKLDETEACCSFYVTQKLGSTKSANSYSAKIIDSENSSVPHNMKVVLYTEPELELDDYVEMSAQMRFFRQFDNAFDSYGRYADGFFISAKADKVDVSNNLIPSPFFFVGNVRESIRNKLSYIIGGDEGVLSNALITGDTSGVSDYVKLCFKKAGVSHIMAVSGLHLSLITGVFALFLRLLRVNKRASGVLSIVLVLIYMAIAGFSGSVVRAGIMMIVLFIGDLLSRRSDSLNSLGLSAFIMCLNPYAVTDVGLLFSITAVFALVTLYPAIIKHLPRNYKDPLNKTKKERIRDGYYDVLSVFYSSLSIGVVTIPIMYIFYSSVSVVSPVSNLFVLPLGSACVVFSLMTYISSVIGINVITVGVAFVTKKLVSFLISVVKFISGLGNTVYYLDYRFGLVIAGIFILLAVAYFLNTKLSVRIAAVFSMAIMLVSVVLFGVFDNNIAKVYVFGESAIFVSYKNVNVVWGIDSADELYRIRDAVNKNGGYIDFLICENSTIYPSIMTSVMPVDTLIYDEFNDTILTSFHQNLEIRDSYSVRIDDDYEFSYNNGDVIIRVKDFSVGNIENLTDAYVSRNNIKDEYATISLNPNGVCYSIYDDNSYSVRRLNRWQK